MEMVPKIKAPKYTSEQASSVREWTFIVKVASLASFVGLGNILPSQLIFPSCLSGNIISSFDLRSNRL